VVALWTVAACASWAQSGPTLPPGQRSSRTSAATQSPSALRLLNTDEGLAILGAALESRPKGPYGSDCSHLVHAIYEKAGFAYAYASSADLYAGADDFRRVSQPQPGDLVVWPGHAGIVVNPAQRTFYSALRSGFGVQPYDSAYWKSRGRAHFFRYLKAVRGNVSSAANRTPTLKPAGLLDGSRDRVADQTEASTGEASEDDSAPRGEIPPTRLAVPVAIVVNAIRPKAEHVRASLEEGFQNTAEALQASPEAFKLYPALVAFDTFEVRKVQLKGGQGWAEVQIRQPVCIAGPGVHVQKRPERQRWSLRHQSANQWELQLPADAIYVPREVAVRVLAHRLAALTDAKSDPKSDAKQSDEKAELARWLGVLLQQSRSR
jgi:hypothetical protein